LHPFSLSLKKYIRLFDIKKWPLDCVVLLKDMQNSVEYPVQIDVVKNISDEFDAVHLYLTFVEIFKFYSSIFKKQ